MNSTFLVAKFWDFFKQKSPKVAFVIYLLCNAIVVASIAAPDYGIGLPKWFSLVVIVATTIFNGANGSRTTTILTQTKPNPEE